MGFNPIPVQDFIGKGLIFPIQLVNGKPPLDSGYNLIRASIITILSFQIGNRFFLSEFGSRMEELIEEPNDEILDNLINSFVVGAVTRWEKRIAQISAEIDHVDDHTIFVSLTYQVLNTNTSDNFIWPFYKSLIY